MPVGAWNLEYGCNTLADPNRVAQYVANAQNPAYCVSGVNQLAPQTLKFSTLRVNCNCDALQWTASDVDVTPTAIPAYRTPALDAAPWYSSSIPESAHFWGWMIEKVENVVSPPISRNTTDRITEFGGSSLGRQRRRGRVMKFTLIGFGAYELAMDYGFRWLTHVLTSENATCETCDMIFRTSCPPISSTPTYTQWDTGRWTFKNVGITDGPHYEDPPNPDAQCNIRRVSFTVVAQVPYAFKCPVPEILNQTWITNLWPTGTGCPPLDWICTPTSNTYCRTVTTTGGVGDSSLVIKITAGTKDISNLVIRVTPNPLGYSCTSLAIGDACDTITVPSLPAGATMTIDGTTRTIVVNKVDADSEDGTPYLSTGTEGPSFPTFRAGVFCVCVSSDRCSWEADGSTISIWTVHRELAI